MLKLFKTALNKPSFVFLLPCVQNFSKISRHYGNVVKLHKVGEEYQIPYNNKNFYFSENETVKEVSNKICEDSKEIHSFELLDDEGVTFSKSTPMKYLMKKDFVFCVNQEHYTSVLDFKEINDALIKNITDQSIPLDHYSAYEICKNEGLNDIETEVVGHFLTKVVNNLQDNKGKVSKEKLMVLLENHILNGSLNNKRNILNIDEQIEYLNSRLNKQMGLKKQADNILAKRTRKRMRKIIGFYLLQIFLFQYGTYSLFCWDIMEPIACLFEAVDAAVAYVFWLSTHDEMELENVEQNYFQKKSARVYAKAGFNKNEFNENEDMLAYLKKKKSLLSDNINHVMQGLNYGGMFDKK